VLKTNNISTWSGYFNQKLVAILSDIDFNRSVNVSIMRTEVIISDSGSRYSHADNNG
jgi:hypothetical protein